MKLTPLIQMALDFHNGKIEPLKFKDDYLELWEQKGKGGNDPATGLAAAKIRSACDEFFPVIEQSSDIDEPQLRAEVAEYLKEAGVI